MRTTYVRNFQLIQLEPMYLTNWENNDFVN